MKSIWRGLLPFYLSCIIVSANGQPSWHSQSCPVDEDLVSVSFASPFSGWAVSSEGTVIHTSNGGWSWSSIAGLEDVYPEKIVFTDTLTGWMAANIKGTTDTAVILKTMNGGQNWVENHRVLKSNLYDLFFLNNTMAWAVGYVIDPIVDTIGLRLYTANGGETWSVQDTGISVATPYTSVTFRDALVGDLCGPGPVLMHTATGGETQPGWALDIKQIDQPVYDMIDVGDQYGCMVGAAGKIIFTRDGWTNFFYDEEYINGDTLWSVDGTDTPAFWMVGEAGTILYMGYNASLGAIVQDQSVDISENLYEVDVLDETHVWVVGQSGTILFYGEHDDNMITESSFSENTSLFPNPAKDITWFRRSETGADVLKVYTLNAKLVLEIEIPEGKTEIPVSLNNIGSGIYFVKTGNRCFLLHIIE